MAQQQKPRDPALDAIRAVAIVMVVAIHVTSAALYIPVGSGHWWSALAWGSLVRPAVPLFFLCSGALMLTRDIPLKRLFGHNLLRIVLAMLGWAFLYRVWGLLPYGVSIASLWDAVKHTLTLDHEFHFYYLHILILVYAFVPLVRAFLKRAEKREVEYALALWFVTGILFPLLKNFWPFTLVGPLSARWLMPMAYSAVGYTVLGWYLRVYGGGISRRLYGAALAAGFVLTLGGSAWLSLRDGALSTVFLEGMSPGPMLMAAGLFGLLLRVERWPNPLRAVTGWLARSSFCIYLVHVLFLYLLRGAGITAARWFPALSIPGITLLILFLSGVVYEVLRRIPVVKTYFI